MCVWQKIMLIISDTCAMLCYMPKAEGTHDDTNFYFHHIVERKKKNQKLCYFELNAMHSNVTVQFFIVFYSTQIALS